MADRNNTYRHFGPKQIEALVMTIRDLFEPLYQTQGLPLPTMEEIQTILDNTIDSLPDYDWMQE